MSKIIMFLADDFEEIEGLTTVDVLRRAGEDVTTVSINGGKIIKGSHNIKLYADAVIDEVDTGSFDAVVLPGGMPGTTHLMECDAVIETVKNYAGAGKLVAAICAAPSVLGKAGVLEGKKATVYPGFEKNLGGADYVKNEIVRDGNIITAPGMGRAFDFALEILSYLRDDETAANIRADVIG